MTTKETQEFFGITIGDTITFRSPTRSGNRKATRKVIGFDNYGFGRYGVLVTSYSGWTGFAVKLDEIISVENAVQS